MADSVAKGTRRVEESHSLVAIAKQRMKDLRTKYPRLDAIRKIFIRYVFMFSLLIQLVFLLILHIFDGQSASPVSGISALPPVRLLLAVVLRPPLWVSSFSACVCMCVCVCVCVCVIIDRRYVQSSGPQCRRAHRAGVLYRADRAVSSHTSQHSPHDRRLIPTHRHRTDTSTDVCFSLPERVCVCVCASCRFLLILLMTLALVRQVNRSAVSPLFLLQSWLSTVSLFCGIYVLVYILVPGFSAFHLWDPSLTVQSTHQVADVVGQFFWFSLCTMTTTGYGDVYPVHIAARIAVCVQMVVSVCYTVVILGTCSDIASQLQCRCEIAAQI